MITRTKHLQRIKGTVKSELQDSKVWTTGQKSLNYRTEKSSSNHDNPKTKREQSSCRWCHILKSFSGGRHRLVTTKPVPQFNQPVTACTVSGTPKRTTPSHKTVQSCKQAKECKLKVLEAHHCGSCQRECLPFPAAPCFCDTILRPFLHCHSSAKVNKACLKGNQTQEASQVLPRNG